MSLECRRLWLLAVLPWAVVGCTASVSSVLRDGGGPGSDAGGPGPDGGGGQDSGTPGTDAGGTTDSGTPTGDAGYTTSDVLMHRRNVNRDGTYIDPYMTKTAVMGTHVLSGFSATISSNTFGQLLFMENGPDGGDTLFVATENNDIYALDANTGTQIWTTNVGAPSSLSDTCGGSGFCGGSISPFGTTGTPAIDIDGRVMYFSSMLHKGVNNNPTHTLFAVGIDQPNVLWKVDIDSTVSGFNSCIQNQRAATLFLNGWVYVAFSGLDGDCGNYKGWVIGVNAANPSQINSWQTTATSGSGIWGTSGPASDGTNVFVATCNTNGPHPQIWDGGYSEAVIKLTPDLKFTESAPNFFTMNGPNGQDWLANDNADADLGSSGLVMFQAPGATPSNLIFVIGKTTYGYLVDRDNLGGISTGLSTNIPQANGQAKGSLLAYNTALPATYVSGPFNVTGTGNCTNGSADFSVLQVTHASPPQLQFAWCGVAGGDGDPIVSTIDGLNEAVLWTYGASGDETARAYDADTGTLLYTSPALPGSTHWISPIVANGRFYVAGNGTVSALTVR
jgi:outer membrane protein assembly factor BamB